MYNALVIDSTLQMGKPQTAMQRGAYFNTAAYTIGGRLYTLNDIEHGVLRCNAKPVGALRPRFGRGDDRLRFSRRGPVDPRLHFALNCGARSCPVVRLYSAERVQAELDEAAAAFCGSDRHFYVAGLGEPVDVEVEEETPVEAREMYGSGEPVARAEQPNEVTLSKIFGWYQVDFVTAWRASGGAQSNGKGSYELMRWWVLRMLGATAGCAAHPCAPRPVFAGACATCRPPSGRPSRRCWASPTPRLPTPPPERHPRRATSR